MLINTNQAACQNGRSGYRILGCIKSYLSVASASRIGRGTVLKIALIRTVDHTNVANGVARVGGHLISNVCIYLILEQQIVVGQIGRQIHVEGSIACILQEFDAMCIALARLKLYLGNVVGYSTIDNNILILFIENVNSVNVILLIPLVEVVCNDLTEASQGRVSLGSFSVAVLDEKVLALDRLCIRALPIVRSKHLNPLRSIPGARVHVYQLTVYVCNSLVHSIHLSRHKSRGNSVV